MRLSRYARRLARAPTEPGFGACVSGPRGVCAAFVAIDLELDELSLEIRRRPREHPIQTLAPDGPNQPFDGRMGEAARTLAGGLPESAPFACCNRPLVAALKLPERSGSIRSVWLSAYASSPEIDPH
jgi:hypothetical protein